MGRVDCIEVVLRKIETIDDPTLQAEMLAVAQDLLALYGEGASSVVDVIHSHLPPLAVEDLSVMA